jgi:hypothetical protein
VAGGPVAALPLHLAPQPDGAIEQQLDPYPTEWDNTRAFPFPQRGLTHCRETCPIGASGRQVGTRKEYLLSRRLTCTIAAMHANTTVKSFEFVQARRVL